MDPPAANQKRKRGRPANAPRDDEAKDASNPITTMREQKSQANMDDGIPMDEESRPRKRGRRAKDDVPQEPQPETSETQPGRRQRRQPSTIQMQDEATEQSGRPVPSEELETAKRGRPRKGRQVKPPQPEAEQEEAEQEEADDENENEGNSSLLRRSKRSRRSLDDSHSITDNSIIQGEEVSATQRPSKKRKKPNRSVDKKQPGEGAESGEIRDEVGTTSRTQKRQGRRPRSPQDAQSSINEPEPDIAMPQRKRGRPSKPEADGRTADAGLQSGSSQRRKKPVDEEAQAESRQRQTSTAHRKSKGRRRPSAEQDQSPTHSPSPDSDSDSSPLPYRHITERTRRITHQVIESKWSSLDPSSIANVAGLLHSVSLPTLLHVAPKQYAHAEDVLQKVIRGLCKRSARLPFPPASTLPRREDELDFERTQSAVEVLLSQLDPLQHSMELLRREKERAEKELERQYKVLDRLSTNARAEARERRDRLKKVHVLVPTTTHDSVTNGIDLLPADKATSQVFAGVQDEEMLGLAGQINNHMESMRKNLQQIDGVLPAIAKSHALLRTTLQPQFDQKQLENIMLGHVVQ